MIPEDGTGLINADSYISVADADAYAAATGWADWAAATTGAKQSALIAATRYIEASYRFKGELLKLTQSLAWPRYDVYDQDLRPLTGVPYQVKAATCELARLALTTPLTPAPEVAAIKRKKIKAGSVETETEYAVGGGSSADAAPSILASRWLSGLVRNAPSGLGGGFAPFVPG
jgi:hypothetical protein